MRLALLLFVILFTACATPAQKAKPASPPTKPPAPRLSPEEEAARAQRKATVDRIAAIVSRLRRLPLKQPLKVGWIGAKGVRARARESIEKELSPQWLEGYVAAFARLGLLPEGYRYTEALLDIMGEQVAGFYDPEAKELYVRHDMPADEMVLAHEIGHALQDQHFGLKKLQGDFKESEDRNFAITALFEGDATQVMGAYLKETLDFWKALKLIGSAMKMASMDSQKLDAAPLYVREGLLRPYLDGWALVKKLRSIGGRRAVDRAFGRPPVSSEQVLHPKKYLAQEPPVKVAPPDLLPSLGAGWQVLHENTLGEFGVNIMLRTARLGAATIVPAARGWGGDRFRAYRHQDGRMALVWVTAWDSIKDASEFYLASLKWLEARFPGAKRAPFPAKLDYKGPGTMLLLDGRQLRLTLEGDRVTLLDSDQAGVAVPKL